MKRILLVVNKSGEADAAFAVLFNPEFKKDLHVDLQCYWKKLKPIESDFPHTRD